jgi:FkbM family methyltransferase
MPTRFGGAPLLVSPDSALSYWRFDLDRANCGPALAAAGRFTRPGDRVFDVGANLGVFAFAAAAVAGPTGQVWAFEPDPFFSRLIMRSVALQTNPRALVHVLTAAVSDAPGVAQFTVAELGRASSFLSRFGGRSTAGGGRATLTTLTVTIDWLSEQLGPPTLLKIDVEGAEAAVLAGAVRTLAAARPRVIVEVGPAAAPAVEVALRAAGYALFDPHGGPLSTLAGYDGDVFAEPPV